MYMRLTLETYNFTFRRTIEYLMKNLAFFVETRRNSEEVVEFFSL
jgi:hypothetical protein